MIHWVFTQWLGGFPYIQENDPLGHIHPNQHLALFKIIS